MNMEIMFIYLFLYLSNFLSDQDLRIAAFKRSFLRAFAGCNGEGGGAGSALLLI